jgi:hypothetical protein
VTSLEAQVTSLGAQVTSLEAEVTSLEAEGSQLREAGEAKEAALERVRDVAIRQNQHVLMNCQIHRQCWTRDVYPGFKFFASPIPDRGSKRFRILDPESRSPLNKLSIFNSKNLFLSSP